MLAQAAPTLSGLASDHVPIRLSPPSGQALRSQPLGAHDVDLCRLQRELGTEINSAEDTDHRRQRSVEVGRVRHSMASGENPEPLQRGPVDRTGKDRSPGEVAIGQDLKGEEIERQDNDERSDQAEDIDRHLAETMLARETRERRRNEKGRALDPEHR